jgi:hypothetical protein
MLENFISVGTDPRQIYTEKIIGFIKRKDKFIKRMEIQHEILATNDNLFSIS